MKGEKVFVDTNVLVYAVDHAETRRQEVALEVVSAIRASGYGVVSTQVMQEFFSVLVRKLGVQPVDARRLTLTLNDFEVISLTPIDVEAAMNLTILHKLSFWDTLILAAATAAGCKRIYSEDFHAGKLLGLTIVNPFA